MRYQDEPIYTYEETQLPSPGKKNFKKKEEISSVSHSSLISLATAGFVPFRAVQM